MIVLTVVSFILTIVFISLASATFLFTLLTEEPLMLVISFICSLEGFLFGSYFDKNNILYFIIGMIILIISTIIFLHSILSD